MTSGGIEGSVAAHVRLRMSAIEQTYLPYNDRCGSMLLKKSFCTRDQNFFWLYTRLSCKDVGDLIA